VTATAHAYQVNVRWQFDFVHWLTEPVLETTLDPAPVYVPVPPAVTTILVVPVLGQDFSVIVIVLVPVPPTVEPVHVPPLVMLPPEMVPSAPSETVPGFPAVAVTLMLPEEYVKLWLKVTVKMLFVSMFPLPVPLKAIVSGTSPTWMTAKFATVYQALCVLRIW
jgi:hypothetical protein